MKSIENPFPTGLKAIDTHAHLDEFSTVEDVIERAHNSGVKAIIAVGQGHKSNEKILELGKRFEGYVFPAIGIHPWEVESDAELEIALIKEKSDACIAIGEIGLDYWIKRDKEIQKDVFKKLLQIAVEKDKPVSIHTRGAWDEAYQIAKEVGVRKAVFHWYSGPLEVLTNILDSGYFISASPAVEYSKAHREAIEKTSIENIVLETDSPVKYKGVEAEPATVLKTLKLVASLKKLSEEKVSEQTIKNAVELFQLKLN